MMNYTYYTTEKTHETTTTKTKKINVEVIQYIL